MVDHDRVGRVVRHGIMALLCVFCLFPFVLLVSSSLTDEDTLLRYGYSFFPRKVSLESYRYLLGSTSSILHGYLVTILVTVTGTLLSLAITTLLAYALSRKDLPGRGAVSFVLFFSMLFNGGTVPSYIMWTQFFHIKDTLWALLLPNLLMSAFYVIMMRTYFNANIPEAILESARMDGAGEWRVLLQIVLPISKPILITVVMMVGLQYWNDWINGLYYITKNQYYSIQILLNRILQDVQFLKSSALGGESGALLATLPSIGIKMAVAVIGVLPVLVVYPFFQKYFTKGITIGSVKG